MKALVWENKSVKLVDKPYPKLLDTRDAIVKVTYSSICTIVYKPFFTKETFATKGFYIY